MPSSLSGRKPIVSDTTNTSASTVRNGKPKAIPSVAELDMRDYFAARALQGLMANKSNPLHFNPEDDAAYVYRIADAMLKAREAA